MEDPVSDVSFGTTKTSALDLSPGALKEREAPVEQRVQFQAMDARLEAAEDNFKSLYNLGSLPSRLHEDTKNRHSNLPPAVDVAGYQAKSVASDDHESHDEEYVIVTSSSTDQVPQSGSPDSLRERAIKRTVDQSLKEAMWRMASNIADQVIFRLNDNDLFFDTVVKKTSDRYLVLSTEHTGSSAAAAAVESSEDNQCQRASAELVKQATTTVQEALKDMVQQKKSLSEFRRKVKKDIEALNKQKEELVTMQAQITNAKLQAMLELSKLKDDSKREILTERERVLASIRGVKKL